MKTLRIGVRIGQSSIAGRGLFAAQDIKKGTRILQYLGEKISKIEAQFRLNHGNVYLFEFNDRYDVDGKLIKNTARYINHSCAPHCDIATTTRTIWIVAARDIQDGEELRYDYGSDSKDSANHPCTCGPGIVAGISWRGRIGASSSAVTGERHAGE